MDLLRASPTLSGSVAVFPAWFRRLVDYPKHIIMCALCVAHKLRNARQKRTACSVRTQRNTHSTSALQTRIKDYAQPFAYSTHTIYIFHMTAIVC